MQKSRAFSRAANFLWSFYGCRPFWHTACCQLSHFRYDSFRSRQLWKQVYYTESLEKI